MLQCNHVEYYLDKSPVTRYSAIPAFPLTTTKLSAITDIKNEIVRLDTAISRKMANYNWYRRFSNTQITYKNVLDNVHEEKSSYLRMYLSWDRFDHP